jgi:hypothetical protein
VSFVDCGHGFLYRLAIFGQGSIVVGDGQAVEQTGKLFIVRNSVREITYQFFTRGPIRLEVLQHKEAGQGSFS